MGQSDCIYILGVPNFANYESSAALLCIPKDGGEIDYVCIGEDRLTRLKHTYMFPLRGIDYCLRHFGLEDIQQVDYIATDFARLPRWHNSGPAYRKLEHDYLKIMLRYPRERILVIDHHDAHAASCYYPSQFDESGVLIVDGMGSRLNTQSAYYFKGNQVVWSERGYDWGIGRLYSVVTGSILPYGPEKGYGKVMGLAAYGMSQREPALSFNVINDGMTSDYSDVYTRYPLSRIVRENVPYCEDRQKVMEPLFQQIAFDVQEECEKQLVYFANYIHQKTGTRRLCIAGGVGLNGRANYKIVKETPIQEVWIQPACSDTGIPFGLALWAYYQLLSKTSEKKPCAVSMRNAYCGTRYSEDEIIKALDRYGMRTSPITPRRIAELIASGKIVAVFAGGAEFGPRALGHRSILADPRDPKMKDRLNSSVKFRESYRPYAPVILKEFVSEYFDWPTDSPFMLIVANVKEDKREVIPSVTHVDGTARLQTVTQADHGGYYEILRAFHDVTGVPVLLNTSFNINKEPIVETPLDALICALGTSIDYLVMEEKAVDCQAYRSPELLQQMVADRNAMLTAEYEELTRKHLVSYRAEEMETYLEEENKIAAWYRDYRAKYELEKLMVDWSEKKTRLLIAGTRAHTKCLYLYIPEFPSLHVAGFVPYDEARGERDRFSGVYREMPLAAVDWNAVDEVLISSHEYQRKLSQQLRCLAPKHIPVHVVYDDACDSLLNVLPHKWPIMNPLDAEKHQLSFSYRRQRVSSNIEFDFEPANIDIGERYAVAINYHAIRPESHPDGFRVSGAVTPARFDQHVRKLVETFPFARSKDLVDESLSLSESSVILTFDDGLKDVFDFAMPVMKRYDVRGSIYVSAMPYIEKKVLPVQKIQILQVQLGLKKFRKAFYEELNRQNPKSIERESLEYAGDYQFYRYDNPEVRQFKLDLNYLIPYERVTPVLDHLFLKVFGLQNDEEAVKHIYLSLDELKQLVDMGHEIGIHTYDHKVLPRLEYQAQKRNIETTRDFLATFTGTGFQTIAYPYGFCDNATRRVLKELNILAGFTMDRRMITPKDLQERWDIPRYDVNDCFNKKDNDIIYEVFAALSTGD